MEKVWDLRERTKTFAIQIVKLSERVPTTEPGRIMVRQLLRSATSVAANYRAARLARSKAEFTSKLQIALEEADESGFWLELLVASDLLDKLTTSEVQAEAKELAAILMSSLKTARGV